MGLLVLTGRCYAAESKVLQEEPPRKLQAHQVLGVYVCAVSCALQVPLPLVNVELSCRIIHTIVLFAVYNSSLLKYA